MEFMFNGIFKIVLIDPNTTITHKIPSSTHGAPMIYSTRQENVYKINMIYLNKYFSIEIIHTRSTIMKV